MNRMKSSSLGLQIWPIRESLRNDPDTTLGTIRKLGFEELEVAGTAARKPSEFASLCTKHDLKVVGIHQPPLTSAPLDKLIPEILDHVTLFQTSFVTVMLDFETQDPRRTETYCQFAELCSEAGAKLAGHGITLCYHCYDFDFKPLPDQAKGTTGFDILLENSEEEYLGIELDTHFVFNSGANLEDVMARSASRVKLIHLDGPDEDGRQPAGSNGTVAWKQIIEVVEKFGSPERYILEHHGQGPPSFDTIGNAISYWNSHIA
jgi:hypothetical protein